MRREARKSERIENKKKAKETEEEPAPEKSTKVFKKDK